MRSVCRRLPTVGQGEQRLTAAAAAVCSPSWSSRPRSPLFCRPSSEGAPRNAELLQPDGTAGLSRRMPGMHWRLQLALARKLLNRQAE